MDYMMVDFGTDEYWGEDSRSALLSLVTMILWLILFFTVKSFEVFFV